MVRITSTVFIASMLFTTVLAAPLSNENDLESRSVDEENVVAREPIFRLPTGPRTPGRRVPGLPGFRIPKGPRTPGRRVPGLPIFRIPSKGQRRSGLRTRDVEDVVTREPIVSSARLPVGPVRRPGRRLPKKPRTSGRRLSGIPGLRIHSKPGRNTGRRIPGFLKAPKPLGRIIGIKRRDFDDVEELLEREVELD